MLRTVTIAVEGQTDAAVARRLLREAGHQCGPEYVRGGKAALDQRLKAYNEAARFGCWLVLRDLDRDAPCAPSLVHELLPDPTPHIHLHIPVRAIEAWLLADAESFSAFFFVPAGRIPSEPESLPNPKEALVRIVSHSRRKAVRDAIIPQPGTSVRVGPGYASLMIQFATEHWQPHVAEKRCESLASLQRRLRATS